jgi:hypothetical protein
MNDRHVFAVKPVATYDRARYFAAPAPSAPERDEDRPHPLTVALTLLLVVGISVGLIGCYMRSEYSPDDPPDVPPTDPPDCDEGAVRCAGPSTVETCHDVVWLAEDCAERCAALGGASMGCDATADDPCQCDYDVIDGAAPYCDPDELWCDEDGNVVQCVDYDYVTRDCDEVCAELLGPGGVSFGCDGADAENPCLCDYDILEGEPAVCEPSSITCLDEATLGVCNGEWYEPVGCADLCVEELGPAGISLGCDTADAENPCLCDYDLLDGDVAYCDPSSLVCLDDTTLGVCNGEVYEPRPCADVCVEALGPGATTGGCNAASGDDPCQCSTPESGSGGE